MSHAAPSPVELTIHQWANLDEDEPGELVDGRLEEEEMPTTLHEVVALWFARVLAAWLVPRAAPGCDGLTLDLDALWSEVDRLPEEDEE